MKYLYETELDSYVDFAAGAVLYGFPGHAAFPARLASEVFRRCAGRLEADGIAGPYAVYDPCCGSAVHLTTIAFLNWELVKAMIASDIDGVILEFAAKNLALLTKDGMEQRIKELEAMVEDYGKDSHRTALASARALRQRLQESLSHHTLDTHLVRADATRTLPLAGPGGARLDIVFADLPYGRRSSWRLSADVANSGVDPLTLMLHRVREILPPHALVALASGNRDKVKHPQFDRLTQLRAGKRRITILRPA